MKTIYDKFDHLKKIYPQLSNIQLRIGKIYWCDGIAGYYSAHLNRIVVNSKVPDYLQEWVMCHEIGHVLEMKRLKKHLVRLDKAYKKRGFIYKLCESHANKFAKKITGIGIGIAEPILYYSLNGAT